MKNNIIALNKSKSIGRSWDLAIEAFLNNCEARNLRPRTIKWYKECLISSFTPYLQGIDIIPENFSIQHIDAYILKMKKKGNSVETINVRLRAVRSLLNFLSDNGYIEKKLKIKMMKNERKIIQTFTEEQLKEILCKEQKYNTFAQYRDYVIVNFLIGTGVRLGTLKEIRIGDIDFVQREIRLNHTKNRVEYIIPLSTSLAKILQEYLKTRDGEADDYLFCNSYGEIMKDRMVEKRLQLYCQRKIKDDAKGIRCSPHTFRHTFAVQYIRNGGDILTLQKLLGHKTLDMTRRYVNLLNADVKIKFAEFSPLDNISSIKNTGRKAIKYKK